MQLLYSGVSSRNGFLAGLDTDRLDVETNARRRNLRKNLKDDSLFLKKAVSDAELLKMVDHFTRSPAFWEFRGRTLFENFCLCICEDDPGLNLKLQALAELDGTVSGLSVSNEFSPWKTHRFVREEVSASEEFTLPFDLIAPTHKEIACSYRIVKDGQQLKVTVRKEMGK